MKLKSWLLRHCFRAYEWLKTFERSASVRNRRYSSDLAADGLPLPPATLRVQVAGTADIESFLHGSQLGGQAVRELLAAGGRPLDRCSSLLDFGCGCGRVLRQWKSLSGTAISGTDLSPALAKWCQDSLPFASVSVNSPEPPLSYPDQSFDAIYAFSVFTHLPADVQIRWLAEFRRVMMPGGLLIFSTHGSHYLSRLTKEERGQFLDGRLVVRFASAAGSNLCSTYHPEVFVRRELTEGWEIAAFKPEGAIGNPRQDAWVLRRP